MFQAKFDFFWRNFFHISKNFQKKIPIFSRIIDNRETSWQSIYLLTAIGMFCGIQFSIFFPTLWPFLNTVDPTASASFFGFITAAFSVGQGLASPVFGYWMNKAKSGELLIFLELKKKDFFEI